MSKADQGFFRGYVSDRMELMTTPAYTIRERLQGYLAHANGIAASLPPDHPYSALPPRIS
jgi:hypothetical protein